MSTSGTPVQFYPPGGSTASTYGGGGGCYNQQQNQGNFSVAVEQNRPPDTHGVITKAFPRHGNDALYLNPDAVTLRVTQNTQTTVEERVTPLVCVGYSHHYYCYVLI